MPKADDEHAELIDRILASAVFKVAPDQCRLLKFLYVNRGSNLKAVDIETRHYKFPKLHEKHNPAHSRERISDLKTRLKQYAETARGDRWQCWVPDVQKGEGYRLEFESAKRTGPELFWQAHRDSPEDVVVIAGSHLFVFDPEKGSVTRYYDFNVEGSKSQALTELQKLHPECDTPGLELWANPYLSTGDVHAHDVLLRWFHKESGRLISFVNSREFSDAAFHRSSPILIGRPRTNRFIGGVMDTAQAAHLGYRLHDSRGTVRIENLRESEREALSGYPISSEGVVGPGADGRSVFGVFARLRNPSDHGHVTIISDDYYAMVIARIAEVTTNDRQSQDLLEQMDWPLNQALPDSFEMLFSVSLSPSNLEGEGRPKLLCWRPYE